MGTNASARTFVIRVSSRLHPLLFDVCTRSLGVQPIAEICSSSSGICNCIDQLFLHLSHGGPRRLVGILHMQQFMKQAEFCVVANVVRQGSDLMPQAIQFRNGAKSDSRRRFFMHGMDHDIAVVESENSVGLIAMGQKASRDCLSYD